MPQCKSDDARIRVPGRKLRFELNYLAWIGFMFGFLVTYSVTSFLVTVILVPHQFSAVDDTWEYFCSIRPWLFGGLLPP